MARSADVETDEEAKQSRVQYDFRKTQSHATHASLAARASAKDLPPGAKKWYKTPNPLRWGQVPPVPDTREVSREYKAGMLSKITFQWMAPLMRVGYKRRLEQNDIWTVNPDRASEVLTARLKASFNRRVKNGQKNPLLWAMRETFFVEFWVGGLLNLMATVISVLSPFTLRFLIQFATDAYVAGTQGLPPPPIGRGLGLAFGICAMQICQSLGISNFLYRGMTVGGQSRAVLIVMIFEKAMRLSERARAGTGEKTLGTDGDGGHSGTKKKMNETKKKPKPLRAPAAVVDALEASGWPNGRIFNLMSVDASRIDLASGMFHMVWTAPLQCMIALVLLLINLSYSALAGFALLVIGVPLLTRVIRSLFRRRKAINSITDTRVGLTQEVLQNVRFVKLFGWESSFVKRLRDVRAPEIRNIQILLAIRNAINAVALSLPVFASMLSFITYSLTNHDLAPAEVFSSLALFNSLRFPLTLFPMVLGQVIDAWGSVKRIQDFLLEEEAQEGATWEPKGEYALELRNASFTWEKMQNSKNEPDDKPTGKAAGGGPRTDSPQERCSSSGSSTLFDDAEKAPFQISDLNLQIGRNELVAVIGTVGSGKSSLLAALAGDMRRTAGDVILGASRALCPQYAWIQNATARSNILFGREMDPEWYEQVIEGCALKPDLEMLPAGDLTEIGERGITISGGQKQRLNIARAIYFDADVVIMDDPLSAVDAHVGRQIFDRAIMGLLKDKARILATHQLWVLSRCDKIVWMDGGRIHAIDTFENLMREHVGFKSLMESTASEEAKQDGVKAAETDVEEDEKKKTDKIKKSGMALMKAEEKPVDSIPWSTYGAYVRASGGILNAPLLLGLLVISQGANIVTSLWLSWWTGQKFDYSSGIYMGVYAALGFSQAALMFIVSVSITVVGTRASKTLLKLAVTRILRAPMSFLDTTPLGRITNRFSRDVDVMDNNLGDSIRMYAFTLSMIISVFILIIAFFPWFAIALVPLFLVFLLAASYYRASAREVKRFESVLRSHVFAKFGEGLSGIACIKAYGLTDRFVKDLRESIDEMNAAYYLTFSNQRWLSVRLDAVGSLLVLTTGILVVTSRFDVPPSTGGLVLSYILAIVQMIQFTVRQLAEVENGMNAVERLLHYGTKLEEEAPLHTVEVRESWPEKGEIIFDNVKMRYRAGLPLVLKGLSLHVAGGERIGIVGRTGAGKSSIVSTLFRLAELDGGHMTIDGIDISTIGLHDLRSRLAIIPQDPTLFKGTVRSNLDPFCQHTDLELWSALRQADLVQNDNSSSSSNVGVIFSMYGTGVMFPIAEGNGARRNETNVSSVISATVLGRAVQNLKDNITYTIYFGENARNLSGVICVSWDFNAADGRGNWTSKGCSNQTDGSGGNVTCSCNHLTNFAVLVDTRPKPVEAPLSVDVESTLSVISIIGVAVSILGLLLTIITLLAFKKLRQRDSTVLRIQFCISVILMLLSFVAGVRQVGLFAVCVTVSVLIHYFTLVSLMWMAAEALLIFQKAIISTNVNYKYFIIVSLICWLLPIPAVVVPIGLNRDFVTHDEFCFISHGIVFYAAFLGPIAAILVFNLLVFLAVVCVVIRHSSQRYKNTQKHSKRKGIMLTMLNIIAVLVLFGLTWLFGAFTVNQNIVPVGNTELFEFLFVVCNSLQGFYVFIFFVVLAKETRQLWLETCGCRKKKEDLPDIDMESIPGTPSVSRVPSLRRPVRPSFNIDEYGKRLEQLTVDTPDTRKRMNSWDIMYVMPQNQFHILFSGSHEVQQQQQQLPEQREQEQEEDIEKELELPLPQDGGELGQDQDNRSTADSGIMDDKAKSTPSPILGRPRDIELAHPQPGGTPHHVHSVSGVGYISDEESAEDDATNGKLNKQTKSHDQSHDSIELGGHSASRHSLDVVETSKV